MGLAQRGDGGRRRKLPGLTIHLVGNVVQCPEPQEPEPITSLYKRPSLSRLPGSAPPSPPQSALGWGRNRSEIQD